MHSYLGPFGKDFGITADVLLPVWHCACSESLISNKTPQKEEKQSSYLVVHFL